MTRDSASWWAGAVVGAVAAGGLAIMNLTLDNPNAAVAWTFAGVTLIGSRVIQLELFRVAFVRGYMVALGDAAQAVRRGDDVPIASRMSAAPNPWDHP